MINIFIWIIAFLWRKNRNMDMIVSSFMQVIIHSWNVVLTFKACCKLYESNQNSYFINGKNIFIILHVTKDFLYLRSAARGSMHSNSHTSEGIIIIPITGHWVIDCCWSLHDIRYIKHEAQNWDCSQPGPNYSTKSNKACHHCNKNIAGHIWLPNTSCGVFNTRNLILSGR